jgi:phytoene synthase
MISLYNSVCQECSKLITNRYSTSFSLGIRVFDKRFRGPIYAIYGFVRFADEIVDTFHGHDKKMLLDRFREDTWRAIDEKISLNPVLHAFQETVHEYQIERPLIEAFLDSMEMDLYKSDHEEASYDKYIYGSAEVVGLMCLRVFVEGDAAAYDSLKAPAQSLGAAFQKVNFLRDMKSDFNERGRVYFPGVDFTTFTEADKKEIEEDIEKDFNHAMEGIKRLPQGARFGVYLAYRYYIKLFEKIRQAPHTLVQQQRIRVPDSRKIFLLLTSAVRNRAGLI